MKSKTFWIAFVIALLSSSFVIYGTALFLSLSDPTFAVEPEYEEKAAHWDDQQRQMAVNQRLGWTVELDTTPADEPQHVDVTLNLFDKYGKTINGATVDVVTFYNARAARRIHGMLDHIGDGEYGKRMKLSPSGLWEFRVTVTCGDDTYTETTRQSILSVPGPAPAES
jgi:hypothetical protein